MPAAASKLVRCIARCLGVMVLASACLPAWADVWGYVDAKGVTHFATERLDDRYQLFFKTGDSFSAGLDGGVGVAMPPQAGLPGSIGLQAPPALPERKATLPAQDGGRSQARLLAYFDVSPGYKAVKHLLKESSQKHGIDYELLQALIAAESGFDTNAVSPKGAIGLMQLMPPTAERYGVKADKNTPLAQKLTDPKTNIRAGSSYLRDLIKMFPGQLDLAVAAYNAGEGAVQRAGNKIPNYPETKNYVKTVMQMYAYLQPPQAVVQARAGGRVRMEMMGGAASSSPASAPGRSNMPTLLPRPGLAPVAAPVVANVAPAEFE